MIDALVQPLQNRVLAPFARALASRGIAADHITVVGFGIGILAIPLLAFGFYDVALVLILINRLMDGLDGAVARLSSPSDRGAYLDIALDFVFYAGVPLGFAMADPSANALAAAVLIMAFVGTGSSFLAYAVIAQKRGMTTDRVKSKGIYYLAGLTEGAETIGFFVLICLFPTQFAVLAYIFTAACWMTTMFRWHQGWHSFSKER